MHILAYNFCSQYSVLYILSLIVNILEIVYILIPIILIIFGTVEFAKAVISSDQDVLRQATLATLKRFAAGIIIFLLPTFLRLFTNFLNSSLNANISFYECLENIDNINYFKELEELKDNESKSSEESMDAKEEIAVEVENSYEENENVEPSETPDEPNNSDEQTKKPEGTSMYQIYTLTNEELYFLTNVAVCEQGISGAGGEATLMANRYELYGTKYSSLYDYVKNSKWFACAKKASTSAPKDEALSKVEAVLVLGNREFPAYVDEHDCYNCNSSTCDNGTKGDICKITTGNKSHSSITDIKNRENYISEKTLINNLYSAKYTFYSFPCKSCDPFGYTDAAKNKYDKLNNS